MRAVTQKGFGGTEQLEIAEVPAPAPGPGEVLVDVRAAGLDRGTWHLLTGLPLIGRPFFGYRTPKVPIIGRDLAGVVTAVGEGVTDVRPGDEVIGTADGSVAGHAVLPVKRLAPKPASLTWEEAAVLPISGLTALQAVRHDPDLGPGKRVLVLGASGGVGSYAVQVAAATGAEVTGVCSGAKADLVRGLGATHVVDYTREEPGADGTRYDLVVDIAGNRPVRRLRRLLTRRGVLVITGGEDGGRVLGGMGRNLLALAWSPFVSQRLTMFISSENSEGLRELVHLVESDRVRPALERTYAFDETPKALEHLAAGHVRGKVAITV